AVLAGEEAGRETVVGHDTKSFLDTQISQWPVKGSAIIKIVFRLQDFIAREGVLFRDRQRFSELLGIVVGRTDRLHLTGFEKFLVRAERFLVRRVRIVPM